MALHFIIVTKVKSNWQEQQQEVCYSLNLTDPDGRLRSHIRVSFRNTVSFLKQFVVIL